LASSAHPAAASWARFAAAHVRVHIELFGHEWSTKKLSGTPSHYSYFVGDPPPQPGPPLAAKAELASRFSGQTVEKS